MYFSFIMSDSCFFVCFSVCCQRVCGGKYTYGERYLKHSGAVSGFKHGNQFRFRFRSGYGYILVQYEELLHAQL